ncbi:MAG TPA: hypothetical protein VMV81_04690, partial [Phycisphaerae bacterium]|nr:hypothetical protein [Phycisphaerae bacterium]
SNPLLLDPANTGQATATDDCPGHDGCTGVTITYQDSIESGKCPAAMFITRTWTATDCCGNRTTCTQHISVEDSTAPTVQCKADDAQVDNNCSAQVPFTATVQDNCCISSEGVYVSASVSKDSEHSAFVGQPQFTVTVDPDNPRILHVSGTVKVCSLEGCPVLVDVVVGAYDCCGNETNPDCVSTVSVSDLTPPVITCPPEITVECSGGVVQHLGACCLGVNNCIQTTAENCAAQKGAFNADIDCSSGICNAPECAAATCQTFVPCVADTSCVCASIEGAGSSGVCLDGSTLCNTLIPCDNGNCPPGSVCAINTCCGTPVCIPQEDFCAGGNRAPRAPAPVGSLAIAGLIQADGRPAHIWAPPGVRATKAGVTAATRTPGGSATDPSETGYATATDNCTSQPVIDYSDEVVPGECSSNYDINRTWTAADNCGNVSTCVQLIHVRDTTAPHAVDCEGDKSVILDENCSGTFNFSAAFVDNCCLDASGITVLVDGEPVDPKNYTVSGCTERGDTGNTCLSVSGSVTVGYRGCGGTVQVTIGASDCCGNATTQPCELEAEVIDNIPPVITCPDSISLTCGEPSDPSNTGMPTAVDNCGSTITFTYSDSFLQQPPRIDRLWTASDECGNSSSCDQIITFSDNQPPVIICPPTLFVECQDDVIGLFAACAPPPAPGKGIDLPPPDQNIIDCFIALGGTVSDNCGPDHLEVHLKSYFHAGPEGYACGGEPEIFVLIFEAVDGVGLTSTCKLVVIIQDDVPPRFDLLTPTSNPADVDIDENCSAHVPVCLLIEDCNFGFPRGGDGDVWWESFVVSGDVNICDNLCLDFIDEHTLKLHGSVDFWGLCGCDATGKLVVAAQDYCGNCSNFCLTINVHNHQAPTIGCLVRQGQGQPPSGDCEILTVPSDAGICGAMLSYSASAWGHCGSGPVTVTVDPPSPYLFPVGDTPVTIHAVDECGNTADSTGTVRVLATTPCTATVKLHLVNGSSMTSAMNPRPIKFIARNSSGCSDPICATVTFSGAAPATGTAVFDLPCGQWDSMCAKDEQHTLWDTQLMSVSNNQYVVSTPYLLRGGDTDNDGDCDINDVTQWVLTFSFSNGGNLPGCPWVIANNRSANFNDDGRIENLDYSFFVNLVAPPANTVPALGFPVASSCQCGGTDSMPNGNGKGAMMKLSLKASDFTAQQAAMLDLNHDGVIDYKDIAIFERQNNLPTTISTKLHEAAAAAGPGSR